MIKIGGPSPETPYPKRGEVWYINLDPTIGVEINKERPVVVISSDIFSHLPGRIVVPVTTWRKKFEFQPNMVKIDKTDSNGLDKDSAGDVLQIRFCSIERFTRKKGEVSSEILNELTAGIVVVIDYSPGKS